MCFSGAWGWKLHCRSVGCTLPTEQLPKTGERRSRRKEQRSPGLTGSALIETEANAMAKYGVSALSPSCCISSRWGRTKWSIQDTHVADKRGVLYSLCTSADLEADLPGYAFRIIPLCNFSLQHSWDVPAAHSGAAAAWRQRGPFLLYRTALHFCILRVRDFASRFFRISERSSQV